MERTGMSIAGALVVVTAGLYLFSNVGLVDIDLPGPGDVNDTRTVVAQPEPVEIIEIEPIALDCRARITAHVPIEGRREHQVLGQTYRTDHLTMQAVGDIDTCVESSEVAIVAKPDGTVRVVVPADAIRFERPRVDAEATMDSVQVSKGWVGKLTDVFPWVADNSGLTPAAYAFAQSAIGSSACMEQAWSVTEQVMIEAYVDEMIAAGGNGDDISVDVVGQPDFGPAEPAAEVFDFEVQRSGVQCAVDDGDPPTNQR